MSEPKLKPFPFCGGKATVRNENDTFSIVGCNEVSMLCPNPSMSVYRDEDGTFDFTYWNRRELNND